MYFACVCILSIKAMLTWIKKVFICFVYTYLKEALKLNLRIIFKFLLHLALYFWV